MIKNEDWHEKLCKTYCDGHRNTPLHNAAKQGNVQAVQILLDRGAKADAVNVDGETPMHLAAENGWHE